MIILEKSNILHDTERKHTEEIQTHDENVR